MLQGNLGVSYRNSIPVAKTIMARLPNTILLMGTALFISLILGVLLGIYSAFKQHTRSTTS